jgi:hypothetical protein
VINTDSSGPPSADPDDSPGLAGSLRKGEHLRGVRREALADYCAHAYNDGASMETIGAIVGRSRGSVAALLSESDIPFRTRERHPGPQRHAALCVELLPAYRAGASLRELATRHGVSPGSIRRILLDNGVTSRRRGGKGRSR